MVSFFFFISKSDVERILFFRFLMKSPACSVPKKNSHWSYDFWDKSMSRWTNAFESYCQFLYLKRLNASCYGFQSRDFTYTHEEKLQNFLILPSISNCMKFNSSISGYFVNKLSLNHSFIIKTFASIVSYRWYRVLNRADWSRNAPIQHGGLVVNDTVYIITNPWKLELFCFENHIFPERGHLKVYFDGWVNGVKREIRIWWVNISF